MKTERKTRTSIPKATKIRSELQRETNSKCPFCNNDDVGHFEIHHIDENPSNNDVGNLILVCPICHSKITKGDIKQIEVFKVKIGLLSGVNKPNQDSIVNNFNGKIGNSIVGNNNSVSIKVSSKPKKQKYPEGCIGFDLARANYVSHLIKRYNEYREKDFTGGKMNYAIFSTQLKNKYKIGPTRTIYNLQISKFEELTEYIKLRIDSTTFAKGLGKNHKNYSSFVEYEEYNNIQK